MVLRITRLQQCALKEPMSRQMNLLTTACGFSQLARKWDSSCTIPFRSKPFNERKRSFQQPTNYVSRTYA